MKSFTSDLLEEIFLLSCRSGAQPPYTFLPDFSQSASCLTVEALQEAVFERLLLGGDEDAWTYLVGCGSRFFHHASSNINSQEVGDVRRVITQNMSTVLQQPDIFSLPDRRPVLDTMLTHLGIHDWFDDLLYSVFQLLVEEEAPLRSIFQEFFQSLQTQVGETRGSLINMNRFIYSMALFMSRKPHLAEVLMSLSEVPASLGGVLYCRVPLGSLMWPSALNVVSGQLEFFDNPTSLTLQSIDLTNSNIAVSQQFITATTHQVFENILRCGGRARQMLLTWIARCIGTNKDRAKLWHTDMDGADSSLTAPDGFFANFCAVLLRLAMPFCRDVNSSKLLDIDPTYCAAPLPDELEQRAARWQHLAGLTEETCLIARVDSSDAPLLISDKFNFRTECFYLCHKAIEVGLRVMQNRLEKMNVELGRQQRVYQEAMSQAGADTSALDTIKSQFETAMQQYLSMSGSLSEPSLLDNANQLMIATAVWLVQQAVRPPSEEVGGTRRPVQLPIKQQCHAALSCVPELIVDNLTSHLLSVGRFAPEQWSLCPQLCHHMFTFIVVFMGSTQRMRNPHLRAHLAACLETMLPDYNSSHGGLLGNMGYQRTQVFMTHELTEHVVESLLSVFVSIEMTGQSVQFEEKFNYRRPMYVIMKFLWSTDQHRRCFVQLSQLAERDIDCSHPPLFLRFINLLMNDAVFLLDEALRYMAQLRDQVEQRQTEQFQQLPAEQRQRQQAEFQHIGQMTRFLNIMGRETIGVLEMLSSGVRAIFLLPSIVDRVAVMLNYFLLQLVGPKRRELKVKDTQDFDFRPADIVTQICRMYVHLRCDIFCAAVAADERSYSPQLFSDACQVLGRIGQSGIMVEVESVAVQVASTKNAVKAEEDLAAEAPDNFLDPIMSTLMSDPVTLPSSGIVCDRSTIARHILSDQTDPFNRQPLTMDMLVPNTTIKQQIEQWRRQKLAEKHA